jgi:hypothetical protein
MVILQIEHKIASFDGWKKAFESDPIDRKKSGVLRYNIFRPAGDLHYVIIHLEFALLQEAEDTLGSLRKLWTGIDGQIVFNPQTRILEVAETKEV